jgi:hypothetical protein
LVLVLLTRAENPHTHTQPRRPPPHHHSIDCYDGKEMKIDSPFPPQKSNE